MYCASAYVMLLISSLTWCNVQPQPAVTIEQRENRYVCNAHLTGQPTTEPVDWLRNNVTVTANSLHLQGVEIQGNTVRFNSSLEMPRDEAIWICRVKSTGETSLPRTRYIRPRIDKSIPRSIISNSTRILNLQCPVSVGPLSRRDKPITVTWSTHRHGEKTPVHRYMNSPYSFEDEGNVIGFDNNDFSLIYNASSITGDSFSMSCLVQYGSSFLRKSMIRIAVTNTDTDPDIPTTSAPVAPCGDSSNSYVIMFLDTSCFEVDLSQEEPCLSLQCISSEQANITILTTGTSPSNGDVVHIFNQHNVRVGTTPTTPLPEVWRCVRVSQQA